MFFYNKTYLTINTLKLKNRSFLLKTNLISYCIFLSTNTLRFLKLTKKLKQAPNHVRGGRGIQRGITNKQRLDNKLHILYLAGGGDLVKCLGTGTEYIQFGVCTGNVQDALNLISMQVPDFQKGYGDFLNKLMTFHYIPLSAIGKRLQNIFNHFNLNKLFI